MYCSLRNMLFCGENVYFNLWMIRIKKVMLYKRICMTHHPLYAVNKVKEDIVLYSITVDIYFFLDCRFVHLISACEEHRWYLKYITVLILTALVLLMRITQGLNNSSNYNIHNSFIYYDINFLFDYEKKNWAVILVLKVLWHDVWLICRTVFVCKSIMNPAHPNLASTDYSTNSLFTPGWKSNSG